MSSQAARAVASDASALRRSAGRRWTTPSEIRAVVIEPSRRLRNQACDTRVQLEFRDDRSTPEENGIFWGFLSESDDTAGSSEIRERSGLGSRSPRSPNAGARGHPLFFVTSASRDPGHPPETRDPRHLCRCGCQLRFVLPLLLPTALPFFLGPLPIFPAPLPVVLFVPAPIWRPFCTLAGANLFVFGITPPVESRTGPTAGSVLTTTGPKGWSRTGPAEDRFVFGIARAAFGLFVIASARGKLPLPTTSLGRDYSTLAARSTTFGQEFWSLNAPSARES